MPSPRSHQWGEKPCARTRSGLSSASDLSNGLLLEGGWEEKKKKKRLHVESTGERKEGAKTSGWGCWGSRDGFILQGNLLKSLQGVEWKQKLRIKISFGDSHVCTLPLLLCFYPTAGSSSGGIGRSSERCPGVRCALFFLPTLSHILTPCLQPDVLTAVLLPALASTLVLIQWFKPGNWSSRNP